MKQGKKTKPMQVVIGGVAYQCTFKNGKITVRTDRTARGQNMVAGVYDTVTKTWHNDSNGGPLPKKAKDYIVNLMC